MIDFWQENFEIMQLLEAVRVEINEHLTLQDEEIKQTLQNFTKHGGKMIRPGLFLLFSGLVEGAIESEKRIQLAASLEILHLATLIHDDIIDDSALRRGHRSIPSKLGKDTAVYAGDYLYTIYFEFLVENTAGTPFLIKNARAMKKILQGELQQKALMFCENVTIGQYWHAIKGKTAELIALACEEGAYFSNLDTATTQRARRIGRNIGLAFQIYDDVLNFRLDLKNEKPILTDLSQGIITLPVIFAHEAEPAIISKYLEHPEELSKSELIELATIVKSSGGLARAIDIAKRLTDKALQDIDKLPTGQNQKLLKTAVKKLLTRKY